ncbi:MAG: mechanosensitive ion channel domain-containing protein [Nannocystaceae bacterium]
MTELPLPESLAPYAPLVVGIAKALVIFVVGWIASRWAASLVRRLSRDRKLDEALRRFFAALAQYAVLAATVIAALGAVGVETTSLIAILGSAALAVGLALQGSLSNFAAGVMLLIFRPFVIDDVVTVGGHTGRVDDVGLFATVLVTPNNERVTIPNAQVTGGSIVNLTTLGTRRGSVQVGVAYGTDLRKAMEILDTTAKALPLSLDDPAPLLRLQGFGASSIDLEVFAWATAADYGEMLHQLRLAVHDALEEGGIEIPFDQIVIHQQAA